MLEYFISFLLAAGVWTVGLYLWGRFVMFGGLCLCSDEWARKKKR